MMETKIVELSWQEIELLNTLVSPIAEDSTNSNFTRTIAVNIITKINKKND